MLPTHGRRYYLLVADDSERSWYQPNSPKAPPRQPAPGELLNEFHVERTHTFWRVELRDHGQYGVEALNSSTRYLRMARTFRADMDQTDAAGDGDRVGYRRAERPRGGSRV